MDITQQSSVNHLTIARTYLASHNDVRVIIFDFIGVNKDLASCRLVSREWKKFVERYLQTIYGMKKHHIETLRPGWEELHKNMPSSVKETIEIAEVRKNLFQSFDKNTFYRSIKMLGKINNPSKAIKEGVLAALHLLVDDAELAKVEGSLDWKFFKKKLLNREFQKNLRNFKPEDITQERMIKFEACIGLENVTEYDQMYASAEARNVYRWAINIVEYKQFLDTLTEEVNEAIKQCKIQQDEEKEFELFENVVKQTNSLKCLGVN